MNARDLARAEGVSEADIARMCWRCGKYGEKQGEAPSPNGNGVITAYICLTPGCPNEHTGWPVQTTKNGTIANRMGQRNMQDTEFTKASAERMNRIGASAVERIKRDAEESIRKPEDN